MRRLERYPGLLSAARKRLEAGIEARLHHAARAWWRTLARPVGADRCRASPEASALWAPAQRFDSALAGEYEKILGEKCLPAMREFARFVREDYLPKARTTDGGRCVAAGDRIYRCLVRQQDRDAALPRGHPRDRARRG
jgi:uncharacterized protein (DUF885 family)